MLSTQLANILRKWEALETRLHLIVVWFHWKLRTKKEGNCSERSRVRRILLTCIQLLLFQFLHVIWSMPTNFALFKKPLDNFLHLTIPRSIVSKYALQVSRTLKTGKALNRASNITSFPPRFCVYKWASSLFTGIVLKFQMHVHN